MNIFDTYTNEIDFTIKEDTHPDMIRENLYIGNFLNASDKDTLKKLGITHILIFASYMEPLFPDEFIYKQVEVDDLPNYNLRVHLMDCCDFINDGIKKGSVLIHCAAGFSRSAAMAIAYLMKENHWTYQQSFEHVKLKRNFKYTNPNYGFKIQLKAYEQELSKQG